MARPPRMPDPNVEGDVYRKAPGEKVMEYDDPNSPINGPDLPGVAPPSGSQTMPAQPPQQYGQPPPERPRQQQQQIAPPPGSTLSTGPILPPPPPADPTALSALWLIQKGKFLNPFTVTLMRKTGVNQLRTAAGTKMEDDYKLCQITIHDASEYQQVAAGVANGSYKPLNSNSLDLQMLLFIAHEAGALTAPPQPPPPPVPVAPPPPPPPAVPQLPAGFQPPPGFMFVQTPAGLTLVPVTAGPPPAPSTAPPTT
jgi:hypothetical protein